MRLQYKLFISFVILLLIFGAATIIFISTTLKAGLEQQLIAREEIGLEVMENRLFPYIANKDYVTVTSILFEEKEIKKESIYYIIVYDKNGNILAHTFLDEIPEQVKHTVYYSGGFSTNEFRINNAPIIDIILPIKEGAYEVGLLSVGYKKEYIDNIISQNVRAIANIIITLAVFSIVLSFFLSRFMVKPVKELARGMEEVSKGNLEHKVEVESKDEIGELAGVFNKMAGDLQKSHKEIKENEKRYRTLFESAADAIFILEAEGKIGNIVAANKAAAEMHGYSINEMLTLNISDLDTPEVARDAPNRIRRMLNGERIKEEITHRRKDGTIFPVEVNAGLLEIEDYKYILAFDRNITERKQAEEAIKRYAGELEESNRMNELFTDVMHHDLLNPLNIVSGYVEILREDEKDPQKSAYLGRIERNLHKGIELIESATKFSRLKNLESIDFEDVDLKDIIDQAIDTFSPLAYRAGMIIENDTRKMPVKANRIIEEVFANLISNAIKHASSGKRIIVNGCDGGDSWSIRVVDFGEGVKDHDKAMIFERFYRKEKKGVKGSGLGLAIAKKIVELHNGRIRVEDNAEGGAIFVVEIPKDQK